MLGATRHASLVGVGLVARFVFCTTGYPAIALTGSTVALGNVILD
jgi:hypothetical protein